MSLPYECYITIGDWSEDGHNQYTVFKYYASAPIPEQQAAYRKSVKKTGVAFDHDSVIGPYAMCVEWKENVIAPFHMELLRRHAQVDNSAVGNYGPMGFFPTPDELPAVILWFIGVSVPGFQFEGIQRVKTKEPNGTHEDGRVYYSHGPWLKRCSHQILNGWWGNLNVQFGYGCYDQTSSWSNFWSKGGDRARPIQQRHKGELPKLVVLRKNMARWYGHLIKGCPYEIILPRPFYLEFLYRNLTYSQGTRDPAEALITFWKAWFESNGIAAVLVHNRFFFEAKEGRVKFRKAFMRGKSMNAESVCIGMQKYIASSCTVLNEKSDKITNYNGDLINQDDYWVAFIPGLDRYYFVNNMDVNLPEQWAIRTESVWMTIRFNSESDLVYLRLQLAEFNIDSFYHVVNGVAELKMPFEVEVREKNRALAKEKFGHAI